MDVGGKAVGEEAEESGCQDENSELPLCLQSGGMTGGERWLVALWQPVMARSLPHACLSTALTADPSNTARPAGHAIPAGCRTSLTADKTPGTQPAGARALLPVQTSGFTAAKEKPVEEREEKEEGGHSVLLFILFYCCQRSAIGSNKQQTSASNYQIFVIAFNPNSRTVTSTNVALQQQHVHVEVALFFCVCVLHFSLQNSL